MRSIGIVELYTGTDGTRSTCGEHWSEELAKFDEIITMECIYTEVSDLVDTPRTCKKNKNMKGGKLVEIIRCLISQILIHWNLHRRITNNIYLDADVTKTGPIMSTVSNFDIFD